MVKAKVKVSTFSAAPRDLEMLEVVARYHGLPDVEAYVTELRPISTRPVGRLSARSGFAFACQHAA